MDINLIYGVVLAGALLHAVWNALVKGGSDTLLSAVGITTAAGVMALLALPWLAQPAPASWPFIAASFVLQLIYMGLVAHIYRVADMSLGYPLMRGTAPLIVTLISLTVLGVTLGRGEVAGIVLLCAGILCMGFAARRGSARGVRLALLNALMIAAYTLVDGTGVRRSGAPLGYTLWIFLLQGAGMLAIGWHQRGLALAPYLRAHVGASLIGGFGSIAAYGTALWAMTLAPIAVIAALRETSILFGVLISALALREHPGAARVAGACILVLGAVTLRLA